MCATDNYGYKYIQEMSLDERYRGWGGSVNILMEDGQVLLSSTLFVNVDIDGILRQESPDMNDFLLPVSA
jgi:hypothetical protein